MSTAPRQASDIIGDILMEIAPERYELLKRIIDIEEIHLADKSSVTPGLIAAEIEREAKSFEAED